MVFALIIVEQVQEILDDLERRDQRRWKKVTKSLGLLEQDPAYPSLHTHPYESLDDVFGERIWESYADNKTPAAWRVWWFYGPDDGQITVVMVAQHP